jgi:hypothetical protein
VTLDALTHFAPKSVMSTVNGTIDPERLAALRRIAQRPTALKKVSSSIVLDVIADVDDPVTLNQLIDVGDPRVGVTKALKQHRLAPRAAALRRRPHRDLTGVEPQTLQADAVLSRLAIENPSREQAGITEWVHTLPDERRTDAVATVVAAYVRANFPRSGALAPLALDVILGRVPGFDQQDWDELVEQRYHATAYGCIPNAIEALEELHSINSEEAHRLITAGMMIPLHTLDRPTDDVIAVLCAHPDSYLVQVFVHNFVTDRNTLIELARQAKPITQYALLKEVTDPAIANALAPNMGRDHQKSDIIFILDRFRGLSTEARLAALTHASTTELRKYFSGIWINQPDPGEARLLAEQMSEGWYTTLGSLATQMHALPVDSYSPAMSELLDELVARCPADEILNGHHELARRGVEQLINALGENTTAWEMVTRMAPDWTAPVRSLADAVVALLEEH